MDIKEEQELDVLSLIHKTYGKPTSKEEYDNLTKNVEDIKLITTRLYLKGFINHDPDYSISDLGLKVFKTFGQNKKDTKIILKLILIVAIILIAYSILSFFKIINF